MREKLFVNGHISNKALILLDSDLLKPNEKSLLLSHLDSCDKCMEKYINFVEGDMGEDSFDELQSKINSAISVENENRKTRRSRFMILQYCKLAVAVCLTLVMFYGGAQIFMRDSANPSQQTPDYIPIRASVGNFTIPERRELKALPEKAKRNPNDISSGLRDGFTKISDTLNAFITRGEK